MKLEAPNVALAKFVGSSPYQNNSPEQLAAIAETIPARRLARPEEIANWVAFLCSEKNTYLTGQTITIDGGFTCQ
jgi:NAD(P)-dependent dehydrogenase (short-subunit alcohol dehydrogenase family)